MPLQFAAVPPSEKADLWAMFQIYAAELAPMVNLQPVGGAYPYAYFDDYWQDEQRWPFWAIQDGKQIGFALVRFAPEHDAMQMAEFFILPAHRRGGAGSNFAKGLLTRFPGPWKIRQILANKAATAFWRRVVEPYGYTEETFSLDDIDRIEQALTVR
ncbi:MAG: GNAT family N-acetyltransferase [Proteobacteria bacterium]|nr:GNAT family N-acetyltransferase [Pseudomonadota bacterium]